MMYSICYKFARIFACLLNFDSINIQNHVNSCLKVDQHVNAKTHSTLMYLLFSRDFGYKSHE